MNWIAMNDNKINFIFIHWYLHYVFYISDYAPDFMQPKVRIERAWSITRSYTRI